MAKQVWDASRNSNKGILHFCIGGINEVNPFSHRSLKNEVFVYASVVKDHAGSEKVFKLRQHESLTSDTKVINNCFDLLNGRTSIYIDFNGSMAFLDSLWEEKLCDFKKCIKGVFVLGGVMADSPPLTMPPIKGVLNRFSCATMNQLYAPSRTASFFSLMGTCGVPIYVVPNNAVSDLCSGDVKRETRPWNGFLKENSLDISVLNDMADLFYTSRYNPPVKAFDFYTALALTRFMRNSSSLPFSLSKLYFDDVYGVSLISSNASWDAVVSAYSLSMTQSEKYAKNSASFDEEAALLSTLDPKSVDILVLKFKGHPGKIDIIS
jgi:hypothetical protein